MKEAMFYEKKQNKVVQCHLCPKNCFIKNNEFGVCGARKNIDGKLYSMVYGRPAVINIDPVEKKPLYHFLPGERAFSIGTVGCNFFCLNCQNSELSMTRADEVDIPELEPEEIVEKAVSSDCKIIAYTYNEPTIFYEYAYDIMKLAHKNKIKNVFVSNGYINEKPLKEIRKYLDGINVDLKFFNEEDYRKITGGSLKDVLRTLKTLKENNIWTEITNLVIPGYNDKPGEIRKMTEWIRDNLGKKMVLHFSRFFPMYKMRNIPITPLKTLEKAYDIAKENLDFVYSGNIEHTKMDNTYCPKCKSLLIERVGFEVVQNNIIDGKCKFCGEKIDGVWK